MCIRDRVNDSDKLFEQVNKYHGTRVLWTTNIWSSEMLHWNIQPEDLETLFLKFKAQVPNDLIVYGHDYCGIDLNDSVNGNFTHVRYKQ